MASIAALAAATLAVVPIFDQRLTSDRLADLRNLARTARPALRSVDQDALYADSEALLRIVDNLQDRTGGRIALYDDDGDALVDTALLRRAPAIARLAEARAEAQAHSSRVTSGERNGLAYAVTVVTVGDRRLTLVIAKRLRDTSVADRVVEAALPLALAIGLAVALLVAYLLSRSLLRRLRRLTEDAEALGTEGLGHPVSVIGGDEVAAVAAALEGMRVRLLDEEASRRAFVATASHELRTPLASLQVVLELIREDAIAGRSAPQALGERVDSALRQTHRLIDLASDLLDLSRVDADVPLIPEPLELGELARQLAPEFAQTLERGGRSVEVSGGGVIGLVDPAAVARIVRVLLDNAVKYGDGDVAVEVAADDGLARLSVSDHGPGLDGDEPDQLFVRFARGAASPGTSGSGLGLAIARGLANAMHGDLSAVPRSTGARFDLTVPLWLNEPSAHADEHRIAR